MTPTESQNDAEKRMRYSTVAVILHWAIAALILYNLTSGLLRPILPRGFFVLHVSSGITILLLSVVRVGWRLTHRPPSLLSMPRWQGILAHGVHFLLYVAILFLPFSGWALVSAKPPEGSPGAAWSMTHPAPGAPPTKGQKPRGPTMVWGLVKLPLLAPVSTIGRMPEGVPQQRALRNRIETFHLIGAWSMLALLLLHIAGAFKHQLFDRQRELRRMSVGRRRTKSG